MTRQLKTKKLINTTLATTYGGWIYCENCNQNIGYLCYVTYDSLKLNYECNCGNKGEIFVDFVDSKLGNQCDENLIKIKNRLCCPHDESPLITILDKKLRGYEFEITCKECQNVLTQKSF